MAPGDIVDIGSEIASVWSNQLSELPNSVGASIDAYSCCMPQGHKYQILKGKHIASILVIGVGLVFGSGCVPESKIGFDSPAPSKRLDAIVDASRLEDDESLLKLVEKLRSQVPTERMFAIRSLEKRIGETFGYDHASQDWQRLEAYGKWIEYLEAQGIETDSIVESEESEPIEEGAQND